MRQDEIHKISQHSVWPMQHYLVMYSLRGSAESSWLSICFPKGSHLSCHWFIKELSLCSLSSCHFTSRMAKLPAYGWMIPSPFSWYQGCCWPITCLYGHTPFSPPICLCNPASSHQALSQESSCRAQPPNVALPSMIWSPMKLSLFIYSLCQRLGTSIIN